MIGIAVATGGAARETIRRFYHGLVAAPIEVPYRVHVDQAEDPQGDSMPRAWNRGILALVPHCRIIVCTDVGSSVPRGLVDHTAQVVRDQIALCRRCSGIPTSSLQRGETVGLSPSGEGIWEAMTVADWFRTGGWDEGACEDALASLAARRAAVGIQTQAVADDLAKLAEPPACGKPWEMTDLAAAMPQNFLCGRLVVPRSQHYLHLFVTSRCSMACPECSQKLLRQAAPDYDMSLDEIDAIIAATKQSHYPPFHSVVISGGDALCWPHLADGVRRLNAAGIGPLRVFTNGLLEDRVTADVVQEVRMVRISRYENNDQAIARLKQRWGGKVVVVDRRDHCPHPISLVGEEVLPPTCDAQGYLAYDGHIYACPNAIAVSYRFDQAFGKPARCPIQPGYIESLLPLGRTNPYCRCCISNLRMRKVLQ